MANKPKIIFFAAILIAACAFIWVAPKPLVIYFAKGGLSKIFKGSSVSILGSSVIPLGLYDIRVKKDKDYDFKIKEIRVSLTNIYLKVDSITAGEFVLFDCRADIPFKKAGSFYARQIKLAGVKISEIKSALILRDKALLLESLTAHCLGGKIKGRLFFGLDKDLKYDIGLSAEGIGIRELVESFKLTDKFIMSGAFTGSVAAVGSGPNITGLSGNFLTDSPGGRLTITDTKFLETFAKNANQPLEVIAESFKDYNYEKGELAIGLDNGNIILDLALEGAAGKRDLTVVLHDFKITEVVR